MSGATSRAHADDRPFIRAAELHGRIGTGWPGLLAELGVPENFLSKKHGPCPGCGGKDRYFFDNKFQRGNFFCRKCATSGGDGFKLLELVFRWSFSESRARVIAALGLSTETLEPVARPAAIPPAEEPQAAPTDRVYRIRRNRCAVEDCDDAVEYLVSRGLWPLPKDCALRAHSSVEYFEDGRRIGRYPGLVADIRDVDGDLVTAHVTYLHNNRKLAGHEPRKLMSALIGRTGCAARLMPKGEVLGIAEGIETALSAAKLEGVPVWSAINATLLAKFEPPEHVTRLIVFADRDEAGLLAAARLMERLQGRLRLELRTPPAPFKDFNDQWIAKQRPGEPHA